MNERIKELATLTLTYDSDRIYEHSLYRKIMQIIVSVEQRHSQELLDRLVSELRQDIKKIGPDKFKVSQ